jgi:hypothetical protein
VETATSVTNDPSRNEGEEPSPAGEARTENSTKRSQKQRRCGSKNGGKVEAPAFRLWEEVTLTHAKNVESENCELFGACLPVSIFVML